MTGAGWTSAKLAFAVALVIAYGALASTASAHHSVTIGAWPFQESGQSVIDHSPFHNDGILGSTPAGDGNDPHRILAGRGESGNRALRFDGDDFVTVPDETSLEPRAIVVVAWVRADQSPGTFRYVLAKGARQCIAASYGLYTGNNGGISFYASNGMAFGVSPSVGPEIWDGRWHFVEGEYRNGTVRLAVDGHEIGNGTETPVTLEYGLPDDDRFYVGAYNGPCTTSHGFIGDIDLVRMWNVEGHDSRYR